MQQLHDQKPLVPLYAGHFAKALWLDGQNERAITIEKDYPRSAELAMNYTSLGNYQEAADILSKFPSPDTQLNAAVRLLRSAPQKTLPQENLPALGDYYYIYLHVGAYERVLEYFEQPFRSPQDWLVLWHASYAPARKTERFKTIVRNAGLANYWHERGWPEFCHPTTGDGFACG